MLCIFGVILARINQNFLFTPLDICGIWLPHHFDYITGYNVGHWIFIKWGIMGSGGRRDTTGSIWCRACTQDCLLFISFALGHFTYWGQNGFEIAYTSTLNFVSTLEKMDRRERSSKNDHKTFQFLQHMK